MRKVSVYLIDSVQLDTLSIVPGSLIAIDSKGNIIADSLIHINYSLGKVYSNDPLRINQPVNIVYRVFPMRYSTKVFDHSFVSDSVLFALPDYRQQLLLTPDEQVSEPSKLLANGNISRGVAVGNSQNMNVTSNLNLQVTDEVAPGLYMEALLSDKNVPVQPNGYTQQIQEFDQVYIRIYDSVRNLQMGDVQINASHSQFLQFSRKILGGDFTQNKISLGKTNTLATQVSAAVSKGLFNRTEFLGIEGIQGPYILKGSRNETYIVILAGTERIYLDGILLERGENADYVVNYNTAELTFTPKHFITKDSRIIAEFEYSDKNYNRFLFYTQNRITFERGLVDIQYFTEGDAKNQPVNQLLTDDQIQILTQSGDNPLEAVIPNIDSVLFDADFVRYKLVDTLVNGQHYDSILVYSTHSDSAFYEASFVLVGENVGNYIQLVSSVNGKVFQWVAPINGVPQGSYLPVQLLVAPQKQQVLIARTELKVSENSQAVVEVAFSGKDANTYSDLDSEDNNGWAFKSAWNHAIPVTQGKWALNLNYETVNKNFASVERYRSAEFNRDWNLPLVIKEQEHFFQGKIMFLETTKSFASIQSELLQYQSSYNGFRNSMQAKTELAKFDLSANASLLKSSQDTNHTQFYRHTLKIERPVWKIRLGASNDYEDNRIYQTTSQLLTTSKKFSQSEVFLSTADTLKNAIKLAYKNRIDYLPTSQSFSWLTKANDIVIDAQVGSGAVQKLSTRWILRNLEINPAYESINQKNEQNLLAQINHQLKLSKQAVTFFTFYEIGTGLENKKEYTYLEVGQGEGIYVWVDYNNNGIPELNEFEITPFPEEANYIRIYTPTADYIKVYTLQLNETIKLSVPSSWKSKNGAKLLASKFINTLTFRTQQKHIQNDWAARTLPIPGFVPDSSQINRLVSFRNVLAFNRTSSKFGVDYIYNHQNQKSLLTYGFDVTNNAWHQVNIHWNINTYLSILNSCQLQHSKYTSAFFTDRNYDIQSTENLFTLHWQPDIKIRLSVIYQIKNKENSWGGEKALLQETGPEIKLNSPKQGVMSAKASMVLNQYNGSTNDALAYTMLEGYQPGENYRWSITFTRNLNQFLRVNISYNGRKPANQTVIHSGQVSASAYF